MGEELFESEVSSKVGAFSHQELARLAAEKIWQSLPRKQRRSRPVVKLQADILQLIKTNPQEFERLYAKAFGETIETYKAAEPIVIRDIPNILNRTVGVLSLSEEADHPLMWSHYAANHSGFVMAFDETHRFFTARRSAEDDLSGLHQIVYSTDRPHLNNLIDPTTTWIPLFFTKDANWSYEKEWRMVRPLEEARKVIEDPKGHICLFDLPLDSVCGIIFGCQMPERQQLEYFELLRSSSKCNHLFFSKAVRDERTFALHLETF